MLVALSTSYPLEPVTLFQLNLLLLYEFDDTFTVGFDNVGDCWFDESIFKYLLDTYPYPLLYLILYHPVALSVPSISTFCPTFNTPKEV